MHSGESVITVLEWYLRIGAGVALVFAILVGRVVPTAKGGSIAFRLLMLPGATLLWPLVVVRSVRALLAPAPKDAAHP